MTAEMEIYCIPSSTHDILKQLRISLAKQGDETVFGNTILKIHHPGRSLGISLRSLMRYEFQTAGLKKECRKEEITLANHKGHSEPIATPRKYKQLTKLRENLFEPLTMGFDFAALD